MSRDDKNYELSADEVHTLKDMLAMYKKGRSAAITAIVTAIVGAVVTALGYGIVHWIKMCLGCFCLGSVVALLM